MKKLQKREAGFTLLELILAMAVFAAVLTLCLTVFIQINRLFYRGVSVTKTQNQIRNLGDELTSQMQVNQLKKGPTTLRTLDDGPRYGLIRQGYYCLGETVYYYKIGIRSNDISDAAAQQPQLGNRHVLTRWTQQGFCDGPLATPDDFSVPLGSIDLVDDNTVIYQFDLTAIPTGRATITFAYGSRDLIDPSTIPATRPFDSAPDVHCQGSIQVTFCGVSKLDTEVVTRTK